MRLVDTHCHLQDAAFDPDREEVIARTLESLAWCVVIGDDLESSQAAAALTRPGIYAAVGVHPYHPQTVDDGCMASLQELAQLSTVVAIGEIGLDYHRGGEDRAGQRTAFVRQLALAAEEHLPVVIHNRDADADTVAILSEHSSDVPGIVMHCFSGERAFAERCAELGFHVSFAGNVSFPKADSLREAAVAVPLDRLLIETDAPYLAPQPKRGQRCEPSYVQYTAEALADARGENLDLLVAQTTRNAAAFFGVSPVANPLVS